MQKSCVTFLVLSGVNDVWSSWRRNKGAWQWPRQRRAIYAACLEFTTIFMKPKPAKCLRHNKQTEYVQIDKICMFERPRSILVRRSRSIRKLTDYEFFFKAKETWQHLSVYCQGAINKNLYTVSHACKWPKEGRTFFKWIHLYEPKWRMCFGLFCYVDSIIKAGQTGKSWISFKSAGGLLKQTARHTKVLQS